MAEKKEAKESTVFGLDIGTRAVVGVVGLREKDKFSVIGIESIEHDTRAMIDGQIHDIEKVAATVAEVKERLEKKCKVKLNNVCIAAAGRVLKTENIKPEISFDEETLIQEEHVFDLLKKGVEDASKKFQNANKNKERYYCVGRSVVKYFLNDSFITNLLNHNARKIGAEMICTFLPYDVVDGLYRAVEMAGLEVSNLTLEPIAAIEVAIPEKFRMLNIALVDVGAGTSDICITKDGSVTAYGMIPVAGDSLTEIIANHCLVEFNEAERIKREISQKDKVKYEDILGLENTISKKDVMSLLDSHINDMTKQVSDEIVKLNGGNVSAVFVVGGGGKIEGYISKLAKNHGIQETRVALRGEEVMGKIEFKDDSLAKDSTLVTPLGICLHYYDENNSFINVSLNDERIKLYDNGKLTVIDAVLQSGIDNADLFPKRGESIEYYLNGEKKTVKGEPGEPCTVLLNNEAANLHSPIHSNDIIILKPSTKGKKSSLSLSRVSSSNPKLNIIVNDMKVTLPNLSTVNGEIAIGSYKIKNNDRIEVLDYLTVSQVLELVDINIDGSKEILVNNNIADLDTKIYSMFEIKIQDKAEISYKDLPDEIIEESRSLDSSLDDTKDISKNITVTVNKQPIILKGKDAYVYVDVFDYIEFDLVNPHGSTIVTLLNGNPAEFLEEIHDGDVIEIYWKD